MIAFMNPKGRKIEIDPKAVIALEESEDRVQETLIYIGTSVLKVAENISVVKLEVERGSS